MFAVPSHSPVTKKYSPMGYVFAYPRLRCVLILALVYGFDIRECVPPVFSACSTVEAPEKAQRLC